MKTYVFISSGGTRGFFSRYVPYSKMKIGVEDAIKELDFEQAIILRPGLILQREKPKAALLENIVQNLNKLGQGVQDMIGMTILSTFSFLMYWVLISTCRSGPNCHRQSSCCSCPYGRRGEGTVQILGS